LIFNLATSFLLLMMNRLIGRRGKGGGPARALNPERSRPESAYFC
jgi:hypothetical protein